MWGQKYVCDCEWSGIFTNASSPGTMLPFFFPVGRLVEGKGLLPTKMMREARMGLNRPFLRITEGQHTEVYIKNRSSE